MPIWRDWLIFALTCFHTVKLETTKSLVNVFPRTCTVCIITPMLCCSRFICSTYSRFYLISFFPIRFLCFCSCFLRFLWSCLGFFSELFFSVYGHICLHVVLRSWSNITEFGIGTGRLWTYFKCKRHWIIFISCRRCSVNATWRQKSKFRCKKVAKCLETVEAAKYTMLRFYLIWKWPIYRKRGSSKLRVNKPTCAFTMTQKTLCAGPCKPLDSVNIHLTWRVSVIFLKVKRS